MPEAIAAVPDTNDTGLPNAEDGATIASIEGTPPPVEPISVEEPVSTESPAEPVQAVEPATQVAPEPVATEAPATDPAIDASLIMGQNVDLINQIQTLLPAALEVPQIPASNAEPQLGAEEQKSVFEFDSDITDRLLENPQGFAEHIAQVVSQHVAAAAPMMIQDTLKANDVHAQEYQEVANAFYGENPELVGHEQTVKAVAKQLSDRFPAISPPQLLAATAQMVKGHILNTVKVTDVKIPGQTVQQLGAVGNAGEVGVTPQLSEQDQEFEDTLAYAQNNTINLLG